MAFEQIRSVYFLGIGGIGMSALARYFLRRKVKVSGYDKTASPVTDALMQEGAIIGFDDSMDTIPEGIDLVVRTPAVPSDHAGYRHLRQTGISILKRAEVLGAISGELPTIAVAGTHGKTSITTLLAHIFLTAEKETLAFLGGISRNYHTNYLEWHEAQGTGNRAQGTGNRAQGTGHGGVTCIVEADEYDRSFLQLHPDIAIITSTDADHLDIYENLDRLHASFAAFAHQIRPGGTLICHHRVSLPAHPSGTPSSFPGPTRSFTYAPEAGNDPASPPDFYATYAAIRDGLIYFDLVTPTGLIQGFESAIPGRFNLENAIAALAAAWTSGIREEDLRKAIRTFRGVERRFDIRINRKEMIYIDDYAHHPEEISACIRAIREWFPGKKITGVFQPHLYSRTRDLASGFAAALGLLDQVILLEIYPAREKPIPGVSSDLLLNLIPLADKWLIERESLIERLKELKPEILVTLGAGDIDKLVKPIEQTFG